MAEYQNTVVSSGEITQRFIEFVLMQARNAGFMLGQIPNPQTGKAEVNLEMAQLLINQLVMIQEKTKGNLNSDESRILGSTISSLQISYVEAARGRSPNQGMPNSADSLKPSAKEGVSAEEGGADNKKKFVKNYGS